MRIHRFAFILSICFLFLSKSHAQDPAEIRKMMDSFQKASKGFEEVLRKQAADMQKMQLPGAKQSNPVIKPSIAQSHAEPIAALPKKKPALLAAALPFNGAQLKKFYKTSYDTYYKSVKDKDQKKKVDSFFASSSVESLNQVAVLAYMGNRYDQAILYTLRILERDSSNVRVASNLGAICNTAGIPEKAIPVLEYYLKSRPTDPSLLNNCGQSYLMLGDIAKAKHYLARSLRGAPWHPEANASLSWIAAAEGNKTGAINYAVKSLESSYNETAIEILDKLVPERKEFYKKLPVPEIDLYPPSKDIALAPELQIPTNCLQVNGYLRELDNAKKIHEGAFQSLMHPVESDFKDVDPGQLMARMQSQYQNSGSSSSSVSVRALKGQLLIKRAEQDYLNKIYLYQLEFNDFMDGINKSYRSAMEAARSSCADAEDANACLCLHQMRAKDAYLAKLSPRFNTHRTSVWAATSEYARVLEYWEPLLFNKGLNAGSMSGITRKTLLLTTTLQQMGLDIIDLQGCDTAGMGSYNSTAVSFSNQCSRFNFSIPFFIGEFSLSCEKAKIKFGEGIIIGGEYEFRTGQSTVMAGPGVQFEEGLVNASASALFYYSMDKDGNYSDMGVKLGADASVMKVGPINAGGLEAEASFGIESGIKTEAAGKMLNHEIYNWKNDYYTPPTN